MMAITHQKKFSQPCNFFEEKKTVPCQKKLTHIKQGVDKSVDQTAINGEKKQEYNWR